MEEKIIYRGIEIEIYQDDYCESPNDWGNTDCFLVSDYRNFFVQRKNFSVEELSECNGFFNGFYVFPVSIYDHSGIALSLGRSYGWDYSNDLCFVLVRREKGSRPRAAARERAENSLNCGTIISVMERMVLELTKRTIIMADFITAITMQ